MDTSSAKIAAKSCRVFLIMAVTSVWGAHLKRRLNQTQAYNLKRIGTSAQKSRHQPCAKDRQQYCSATLGFHSRFHEISPFSIWFPSCCWSLRQESRRPARCFIVRFESGASIGRRLGEISETLWTAAR